MFENIYDIMNKARKGKEELEPATTTSKLSQLVTNVKPKPVEKSKPVNITEPLNKKPPEMYEIKNINVGKPRSIEEINKIPATKLLGLADIKQNIRRPFSKPIEKAVEFEQNYDILSNLQDTRAFKKRYDVPIIGGTIALTDITPASIPEAALWAITPSIGKIAPGVGGFIKSTALNTAKFGVANEAINETYNLTSGEKLGTGAGEALLSGGIFGAGGTALAKTYPYASKFIRSQVSNLAKAIYSMFPQTTKQSLNYSFAKASRWFNPKYALVEKPTQFFLYAVNKARGIHNEAQVAASNAINFIDSKEIGPQLDAFADKLSSQLNINNLNRYQATAYILRLPENDLKALMELNPEFKDLIKLTKDKLVEYKTNVVGAKEPYLRNRQALKIKRTMQGKTANEMDWENYLTTAKGPNFALLEKDTPLLKEIADNYKTAEDFWKSYYGSISYPVILDQFFRIGRGLSAKLKGKYVYTINEKEAVNLSEKVTEILKPHISKETLTEVKEIIKQKLQTMPVAGSYSELYKEIYNLVENSVGKLPDYEVIKKEFDTQYKDNLYKNINTFKEEIKNIRANYKQQIKNINKQLRQEYSAGREHINKNFSQDIEDVKTQYKQNYAFDINNLNKKINNIKLEYSQQIQHLNTKIDELLSQAEQTKNKELYEKLRQFKTDLNQKYQTEYNQQLQELITKVNTISKQIKDKELLTQTKGVKQSYNQQIEALKNRVNELIEQYRQTKYKELYTSLKNLKAELGKRYKEEAKTKTQTLLGEKPTIKKDYQKSLQEEIDYLKSQYSTKKQQHKEAYTKQKEEIIEKMKAEEQAKKKELLDNIKYLRGEYKEKLKEILKNAGKIRKEQITNIQKILHRLYDVPEIRGMTTEQEANALKNLFLKADELLEQEDIGKLSVAKQMQFYQDIAMALHNLGASDIVENKLVPGLPINEVINDIHNLVKEIDRIQPQSYYFLREGFNGNIVKTISEYLMPSEYYGGGQYSAGTFDKFFTTLKRISIGLVPFFHQKSLTFSSIYNDGSLRTGFEGIKNTFMDKKAFADKMSPLLRKTSELLRMFPKTSTILSGTTEAPFKKGQWTEKLGYLRFMDDRLWNRMYNYYKVHSFANIYDDLVAGKITREQAEQMIKNVNIFFGGLPELANLNPRVRQALRWFFFAPDWELSLVKQLFGGVLGLDEDRVRYFYNILAFNLYLNSAINATRGIQPDSTDWHKVFNAVKNNDVGRLFTQTVTVNGIPIDIDILGYESEMWTLFYSFFQPILQSGAIDRGTLTVALNNFFYHFSTKANPGIQEISSIYNYINTPSKEDKDLIEAIFKPFMPYFLKGFVFPGAYSNWVASGAASLISTIGVRTKAETETQPLANIMTSGQKLTPQTYEKMSKYVNHYLQKLEESKQDPTRSYEYNLYHNILNRGFYSVIPQYKSYLNQYKSTNDAKKQQEIANRMQEYTNKTAKQMYEKMRHSLFYKIIQSQMGEKNANEYIANIVANVMNYAYMRARQQSTKDQKSQIFPDEEKQQQTQTQQTQQPIQQEQPQPQQQSNSQDIGTIIKQASQTYGVPEKLIKAVIQAESSGNPDAVSPKGAVGLMQLEPSTAQELGVTDINDPQQNIMGGAKYLSYLIKKYNGDFVLALAAYNAGPNAVDKYGGVPPNGETIDYINRVAGIYNNS
jgi:hypothetical protein